MASVFLTEKSTKDDVLEFLKENGFEELIEVFKGKPSWTTVTKYINHA